MNSLCVMGFYVEDNGRGVIELYLYLVFRWLELVGCVEWI